MPDDLLPQFRMGINDDENVSAVEDVASDTNLRMEPGRNNNNNSNSETNKDHIFLINTYHQDLRNARTRSDTSTATKTSIMDANNNMKLMGVGTPRRGTIKLYR